MFTTIWFHKWPLIHWRSITVWATPYSFCLYHALNQMDTIWAFWCGKKQNLFRFSTEASVTASASDTRNHCWIICGYRNPPVRWHGRTVEQHGIINSSKYPCIWECIRGEELNGNQMEVPFPSHEVVLWSPMHRIPTVTVRTIYIIAQIAQMATPLSGHSDKSGDKSLPARDGKMTRKLIPFWV